MLISWASDKPKAMRGLMRMVSIEKRAIEDSTRYHQNSVPFGCSRYRMAHKKAKIAV